MEEEKKRACVYMEERREREGRKRSTQTLTHPQRVHSSALPQKAIEPVHLTHRHLRPPFLFNNRFYFLAKNFDVRRLGGEAVKGVS
jgi:hypothetical protein